MKIAIVLVALVCGSAIGIDQLVEENIPTGLDEYVAAERRLADRISADERIRRLAKAFETLKPKKKKRTQRKLRFKNVPLLDHAMSATESLGRVVDIPFQKLGYPLVHTDQQAASLGIGTTAFATGVALNIVRGMQFKNMERSLQQKYQINGLYITALETENLEMQHLNKRLLKLKEKTERHRRDLLDKMHYTTF